MMLAASNTSRRHVGGGAHNRRSSAALRIKAEFLSRIKDHSTVLAHEMDEVHGSFRRKRRTSTAPTADLPRSDFVVTNPLRATSAAASAVPPSPGTSTATAGFRGGRRHPLVRSSTAPASPGADTRPAGVDNGGRMTSSEKRERLGSIARITPEEEWATIVSKVDQDDIASLRTMGLIRENLKRRRLAEDVIVGLSVVSVFIALIEVDTLYDTALVTDYGTLSDSTVCTVLKAILTVITLFIEVMLFWRMQLQIRIRKQQNRCVTSGRNNSFGDTLFTPPAQLIVRCPNAALDTLDS